MAGRPEYVTHIEVNGVIYGRNHPFLPWRPCRWMNVETKAPVVRGAGRNFGRCARMTLELADGRRFWFPVRGTSRAHAVMTAVDDRGDRVARFRSARGSGFEVVVAPHVPITTVFLLVAVASSPSISTSFDEISGGGSCLWGLLCPATAKRRSSTPCPVLTGTHLRGVGVRSVPSDALAYHLPLRRW